ncbi:MAG: dTMP kinase [Lachnospiraceae bacterium]|nr:dTMP kinase [Lachnospiraceae bacterium]
MANGKRGAFVVLEGIDGSGKGTQIRLLKQRIEAEGCPVCCAAEPNDSPFGAMIHQIMTGRIRTTNDVIAALFVADRLDHIQNDTNGLLKYLNSGINVLEDRYYFSSYAYQSVDLPMDWIMQANAPCEKLLRADMTLFIDVTPETAIGRIEQNRMSRELFEEKDRLARTRERYFEAFEKRRDTENVVIIDGEGEVGEIAEKIWKAARHLFRKGK